MDPTFGKSIESRIHTTLILQGQKQTFEYLFYNTFNGYRLGVYEVLIFFVFFWILPRILLIESWIFDLGFEGIRRKKMILLVYKRNMFWQSLQIAITWLHSIVHMAVNCFCMAGLCCYRLLQIASVSTCLHHSVCTQVHANGLQKWDCNFQL